MACMESFGPFAKHPAAFKNSGKFVPDELEPPAEAFTSTNMGLQITVRVEEHLERFSCPVAILACRLEDQYACLVGITLRFHSLDSFTRLATGTCWLLRRDEVANSPYRALRFLTNNIPPTPGGGKQIETYSCLIRQALSRDIGGDLTIWDVEPPDAWEREQRIFSITGDDVDERYIVLHLRRHNGDGYAIVLETVEVPNTRLRRWEYCVFLESPDQPRSYDFYSRTKLLATNYMAIWTSEIEINEGEPVLVENCVSLRMIDIEHAKYRNVRVPIASKGGISRTPMRKSRHHDELFRFTDPESD
ncbi:hypothetical protein N431DRAFT_458441 [Stipitochalara longipes BDJ]|nr:hypothetical protein N431DRAFT_458441 [Stipitochalara longipes BDJ]